MHRYDDLKNYRNERSLLLAQIREDIEEAWYQWELQQNDLDVPALQQMSAEQVSFLPGDFAYKCPDNQE